MTAITKSFSLKLKNYLRFKENVMRRFGANSESRVINNLVRQFNEACAEKEGGKLVNCKNCNCEYSSNLAECPVCHTKTP